LVAPAKKSEGQMINWFPLPRVLLENPIFIMCTPAEKLFLLHIASEVNLRGSFYRADLEEAVPLRLSEDKVRRSRREFMRLGWLEASPGFRAAGRHLATRYLATPGARRGDGDFYAPFHRFTFECLLSHLRHGGLSHADVVIYTYLTYFRARTGREDDWFFITKNELRDLTGLPSATVGVGNLRNAFTFAGGHHLFEVRDEYHRLVISRWVTLADPSEDETNAKNAERYRAEVAAGVKDRKHPKPKRPAARRRPSYAGRR
jgi:hypothetical protein